MARFRLSPGGLEGGESMSDLYQMQLGAAESERTRQVNMAKSTIGSLISSYNTAKSQPLQQEIINTMKNYYNVLPPVLRAGVEPYIAHGPTSPAAEKKREFLKLNPYPRQPIPNEAPGAEMTNKYAQVDYLFKQADHRRALDSFIFGSASAEDKQTFIPLEDGGAAIRTAEGQVMLMSQADLGLKELEKKYGISAREMMLNPNGIPTGRKGFMNIGGRKIETEETIRPFEPDPQKRVGQRVIGTSAMPKSQWDIDHPASLRKLMIDWKNPGADDDATKDWKERAKGDPKNVAVEMGRIWPQYTFRLIDTKKESFLKWVVNILPFVSSQETSGALIPIRGKPVGIPDSTGYEITFYYDPNLDLVSNGFGEALGSYEQVVQSLSGKIIPRKGAK